MPLTMKMRQTKVRAWRGYTRVRRKDAKGRPLLPRRMVWMEPEASVALETMQEACNYLIEITDCYRSVVYQAQAIREQKKKRRLFAPPTKSGHNFGFSVDIKIKETLENFRKSKDPVLMSAGRDRSSLVRWMKQFGWTGIKKESWHFNYLGDHGTTVKKIENVYAPNLTLSNNEVQQALNKLVGSRLEAPLVIDGMIGPKTDAAGKIVDAMLVTKDKGAFSQWFRRVLAGATVIIEEVSDG